MKPLRILLATFAALVLWALASGAVAGNAGADPSVRTVPSADQVLTAAPTRVEVEPSGGATTGVAKVLDTHGAAIASGALRLSADGMLQLALPQVKDGVYLVTWTAGSDSGSFGFDVAGKASSPATLVQPKPKTALDPLQDNLVEWIPMTAVMIFVGALAVRLLVSAPAARRAGSTTLLQRCDLRLVRLAAVAIVVFVPTTFAEMAYSDSSFDFGSVWPSLGADADGHVLGARLALTLLAALAIVPMALRRSAPSVPLVVAGLVCALLELTGREVPTSVPPDVPRSVFNTVLYVAHLFGAAIWIGGLVALLALLLPGAVPTDLRRAFWPVAIRRFSAAAMISVGVLTLSGLWLYWVHVGGVGQLVSTLYGRTLLVKLIVVAVLVLIGASNQFWLMPLLDGRRNDGEVGKTIARHFRTTIAVEVILGLGVLFIAPLLGGSARNQAFQASQAALTQTATAAGTKVELIPSALQPGLVDYLVKVDGASTPNEVSLTFASQTLGIAAQQITATALGKNVYRASGYLAPVVGTWQVAVQVDDFAPATFTLPVTAKAEKLPRSAPPAVRWTTWVAGIAETLLVAAALVSAFRISRRLAAGHPDAEPPTVEPERDLVDA